VSALSVLAADSGDWRALMLLRGWFFLVKYKKNTKGWFMQTFLLMLYGHFLNHELLKHAHCCHFEFAVVDLFTCCFLDKSKVTLCRLITNPPLSINFHFIFCLFLEGESFFFFFFLG
jgi:hypothetical protein